VRGHDEADQRPTYQAGQLGRRRLRSRPAQGLQGHPPDLRARVLRRQPDQHRVGLGERAAEGQQGEVQRQAPQHLDVGSHHENQPRALGAGILLHSRIGRGGKRGAETRYERDPVNPGVKEEHDRVHGVRRYHGRAVWRRTDRRPAGRTSERCSRTF